MKKRNSLGSILISPIIVLSMFLVFYPQMNLELNHVGFWFTLALGLSIGSSICRLALWFKARKEIE